MCDFRGFVDLRQEKRRKTGVKRAFPAFSYGREEKHGKYRAVTRPTQWRAPLWGKEKREKGEIARTRRVHSQGYTYIIYNRKNKREKEMLMGRTEMMGRMEKMEI